jgi:RHS repeat-associated protein
MFDPYGRVTVLDGNGTPRTVNESLYGNPWTFTGRRLDQETGLMYYRNRMYETGLGRFCQRDPIGYKGGMGLYTYVSNEPAMLMDPSGLDPKCCQKYLKNKTQVYYYKSYLDCYPDESVEMKYCCGKPPASINWCGPDITAELKKVRARVEAEFLRWTTGQKWKACANTFNILDWETGAFTAWDIYPLRNTGVTAGKCPTKPKCEKTVELAGTCMWHYEANYYLFGVITRLCENQSGMIYLNSAMGRSMVYLRKAWLMELPTKNTTKAFELGYGWGGGKGEDVNGCQVNCGAYSTPFDWTWLPYHIGAP